jgi:hypothetical protein
MKDLVLCFVLQGAHVITKVSSQLEAQSSSDMDSRLICYLVHLDS